jgi:hypothetical protein
VSLPDHIKGALVDAYMMSPLGIAADKRGLEADRAIIVGYDPITHTAQVRLPGGGNPLRVRVATHLQGALTGTGGASAQTYGQEVYVQFNHQGGLYNDGVIVGSVYGIEHKAPAYAPWQQDGTGHVMVHGKSDGSFGNAEHVNAGNGMISRTVMGPENVEVRHNRDTVLGGSNMPRAEEQIRLASDLLASAADGLGLRG